MLIQNNIIFRALKLFKTAFAKYKRQIAALAVLIFFSGLLEGIGINAVIPVFSIIYGGEIVGADAISQTIKKFFFHFNFSYTVRSLLIFIVLLFVFRAIILFITQYITVRITTDYEKKTRGELFKLMLQSGWPFLSKHKVGYLDQILITDISRSSGFLVHISNTILFLSNLLIYSVIVVNISLTIALLVLLLGVMIFFVFKPLFDRNRRASSEIAQNYKEIAHYINENIIGIKAIKAMFAEGQIFQKGLHFFDRLKRLNIRIALLQNFTNVSLQPIGLFVILGIFAFFYKTAAFNFASFAVMVYAINKVFGNIQLLQGEAHDLSSRAPHLINVLNYKEEAGKQREKDTGVKKFDFKDRLEFKGVHFSYDADKEILFDINFSVKRGEMIGLVGPSGAGKTTIVDLLLRLYEPKAGKIFLDGEEISNISLREWRTNVGYVTQDAVLINDTILNNIKFYSEAISDEEAARAAKMANIHEFIMKQSQRFETVVGERGTRLSGGERQRIILARVLARNPQILILDEATSALDSESEALIQKSIEELKGKVTVIVIAHRPSTIANLDRLLVLEKGRIVEEGPPQELLKDESSYFSKMYRL